MLELKGKLSEIKSDISRISNEYQEFMDLSDKRKFLDINSILDNFIFDTCNRDLANSLIIEANDIHNNNRVDKKRRFLFKSSFCSVIEKLKEVLEII